MSQLRKWGSDNHTGGKSNVFSHMSFDAFVTSEKKLPKLKLFGSKRDTNTGVQMH